MATERPKDLVFITDEHTFRTLGGYREQSPKDLLRRSATMPLRVTGRHITAEGIAQSLAEILGD